MRQIKRLTKPHLYKKFLENKPVEARKISEKKTILLNVEHLLGKEYSNIQKKTFVERARIIKEEYQKKIDLRKKASSSLDRKGTTVFGAA